MGKVSRRHVSKSKHTRQHGGSKKHRLVKQYIKLIATNANPHLNQELIRNSPDDVVKAISNACLNAACGQVKFKPKHKKLLEPHRKHISQLIGKDLDIPQRRRILEQQGGALFLPIILSTVLGALGKALLR